MREGGHMLAEIMKELMTQVKPGVSTGELDHFAAKRIIASGAKPAFKNYQGFPAILCTSVNEEVVHGNHEARKCLSFSRISLLTLSTDCSPFTSTSIPFSR